MTTLDSDDFDKEIKEHIRKTLAVKEYFIAKFLDETNARIQDCVLCEKQDGLITKYWMELKPCVIPK